MQEIYHFFSQFSNTSQEFFIWLGGISLKPLIDYGILISIALLTHFFLKKVIILIEKIIKKSKNQFDDFFWNQKLKIWLPRLGTTLISYLSLILMKDTFLLFSFMELVIYCALAICVLINLNAFLDAVVHSYQKFNLPDKFNIKGVVQSIKILLYLIVIIVIISKTIGETPWKLLSGLGALTAILLLIFREPILGLVSGIQLFANNMIRVGDWIELPSYQVDGTVIDISLTTIQVQNWNKTIANIPTHSLVTNSFKNWRGMEEVGGRRIKRHLLIDSKSVRFITKKEIDQFKKFPMLKEYFTTKEKESKKMSQDHPTNSFKKKLKQSHFLFTNLGIFREYINYYLRHHEGIHQDLTLLVRQLNLTSKGLPLEIYAFTKQIDWGIYEGIQSEIFEHLIAISKEFSLKIFQEPSGEDFSRWLKKI